MLRRTTPILLVMILLLTLLAACGGSREEAPADTAATTAPSQAAAEQPATEATPAPNPEVQSSETQADASNANATTRIFQIVPEQSEAKYAVEEEFFGQTISFVTTEGRTNAIEGQFQVNINGSQIELLDNHFVVDLRTLTSDSARRDNRIRTEWLESNTYPYAEFTATSIENFPADAAEGKDISFQIVGDMTIREITNQVTFDTVARLDGNTLTGTSITNLLMADYGFEAPDIMGMLRVTDGVTVTVNFVAQEITAP